MRKGKEIMRKKEIARKPKAREYDKVGNVWAAGPRQVRVACTDCGWEGEREELIEDVDADGPCRACPDCGSVVVRNPEDT